MCKSWLKLLGLSWLVAELACWLSLSYEEMMRKLFYMGETVMEETELHLCKIPSGFSADVDTI